MKAPSLPWLQEPWSPVGYRVVELPDPEPPANKPTDPEDGRQETAAVAWSPVGYQVVELEGPARPALRPRSSRSARAGKGAPAPKAPPRKRRWLAACAAVVCLLALVLGLRMF
jgi:hypothetical protein